MIHLKYHPWRFSKQKIDRWHPAPSPQMYVDNRGRERVSRTKCMSTTDEYQWRNACGQPLLSVSMTCMWGQSYRLLQEFCYRPFTQQCTCIHQSLVMSKLMSSLKNVSASPVTEAEDLRQMIDRYMWTTGDMSITDDCVRDQLTYVYIQLVIGV